jgi:hypothetical protein
MYLYFLQILQDDSFDGFSYLTSSRSVLDLDHDMSAQLWSTASHKKLNLGKLYILIKNLKI